MSLLLLLNFLLLFFFFCFMRWMIGHKLQNMLLMRHIAHAGDLALGQVAVSFDPLGQKET